MVPLARMAGFDFLVVDMEHGPLGIHDLGAIASAGLMGGFPVYGRVTGPSTGDIARVLDCGATGVIVPHVDSVLDARKIVKTCRFSPVGTRALPGPLPLLGYRSAQPAELCEAADRAARIVAMIESRSALEEVETIAAVEGLDGLIIGSNDLADSLGRRGQLDHPDVAAAFRRIAAAAHDNGLDFGAMGLPPALTFSYGVDLGATLLVVTNDTNLLADGGAAAVAAVHPDAAERA
ncbi:HpcH/HpaI aldolase family protein [Jiella endophytica]|uniref:HpcH/HpaI aldolase family protein n=1 Tax=Jiella endophytica TaxID=2558362 RepID=UPI00198052A0|nr:aldolase/citrate lyase family protein [Jiella endophytica]